MTDQELIQALREHAEWKQEDDWEMPITMGDDLTAAADRIDNQNTHIAALQKAIEDLRRQNKALETEWDHAMLVIKDVAENGKTWMCQHCAHCKGVISGLADCDVDEPCIMPYSQFELKKPEPPEVEKP